MGGATYRRDTMTVRTGILGRLAAPFGSRSRDRPYRCRRCETSFELQHHVCPECGSYTVERAVWVS